MRPNSLTHLTLSLLLAALVGCSVAQKPAPLTREELRTVHELVDFYRLQLMERRDPEQAQRLRERLGEDFDEESLRAYAESLGRDPMRGAMVLRAVRDSLQAMRNDLLGMESDPEFPGFEARIEAPIDDAER